MILYRAYNKFLRIVRKRIFLKTIKSKEQSVSIHGKVYVNASNIKIGKNVSIYPNVYFWGDGEIIIGDNVDIGIGTVIFSKKKIIIGDNSSIAAYCYIIDSNHSVKKDKLINEQPLDFDEEGVVIGDDVWIATGCKILKGSKIENGAVIGAMSMVNTKIDSNAIAFGIPAKVKKYRV